MNDDCIEVAPILEEMWDKLSIKPEYIHTPAGLRIKAVYEEEKRQQELFSPKGLKSLFPGLWKPK